jgi:hypothetical protein
VTPAAKKLVWQIFTTSPCSLPMTKSCEVAISAAVLAHMAQENLDLIDRQVLLRSCCATYDMISLLLLTASAKVCLGNDILALSQSLVFHFVINHDGSCPSCIAFQWPLVMTDIGYLLQMRMLPGWDRTLGG